jgi:Concanavalin A-like lectin/glucanases superfamily
VSTFVNGAAGLAPRFSISGTATTLQGVTGATIACWCAYTGAPSVNEQVIVNVSTGLSLASARANISFRHQLGLYRASARRLDADAVVTVDSVTPISATPRHIAGVFEYNNQIARIYVNGVQEATIAVPGWTGATSATAALGAGLGGRADGNAASSMVGLASDALVFSRALSAAEIANLFYTQGRDNCNFGLGNKFRLQGFPLNAAMASTSDSVGTLVGTAVGAPTPLGSNYIAVNRRRRRR